MTHEHYAEFIKEAFIQPIRSVLIVDDDFPTYREILETVDASGAIAPAYRNKAWRKRQARVANLIDTFRRFSPPLLVDIHDGENVSAQEEVATVTHLHQCDLLVLDYELDRSKPSDGTRAIEILRALMSNKHFNLVVIYTNEDLDIVYDTVRWGLISPSSDQLSKVEITEAENLIVEGEDSFEGFDRQLRETVGSAQYFHSRKNKNFMGTMIQSKQPYTLYKIQTDKVDWSTEQRKLVLRFLLREVELKNRVTNNSRNRIDDLEWSAEGLKWIKSDSAFVALAKKTDNTDNLLSDLQKALVDWNPRPSRLFLTKLRAEIDEYGVAVQGRVLRNYHALAYWYYRLLVDTEDDERRWRIRESVSRHSSQLLEGIQPRVEDFAKRLVQAEIASGQPVAICKDHFRVSLEKEIDKKRAILEHNAFVCSTDPAGWHLTTGHVFTLAEDYWMCLSPACDMVPSQIRARHVRAYGDRLPFIGIQLYKIKDTQIPEDIHSNRYVFLSIGDKITVFCFDDPKGKAAAPRWQLLFAENRGKLSNDFLFEVTCIQKDIRRLVAKSQQAEVVSQVRYEYALNLTQKLGVSLTRIGLDFSGGEEVEV